MLPAVAHGRLGFGPSPPAATDGLRVDEVAVPVRSTSAAPAAALSVRDVLDIHHVLHHGDQPLIAGRLRTEQNWVGGGATPRTAEFIPPPEEEEVAPLVEDLVAYCNRDDMPRLVQRRSLTPSSRRSIPSPAGTAGWGDPIHALLRRRGFVEHHVPRISVVLATNGRANVEGLNDFRRGDIDAWCSLFEVATRSAVDGAARRLIQLLFGVPILDVASAAEILGVSFPAANHAIAPLAAAGVLQPIREQARRSRRWIAAEVLGLLDGFEWHMATPDEAIAPSPVAVPPRRRRSVHGSA